MGWGWLLGQPAITELVRASLVCAGFLWRLGALRRIGGRFSVVPHDLDLRGRGCFGLGLGRA